MNLDEIYQPIAEDLRAVEDFLGFSLNESENRSILAMSNYLLASPGKRIRPALVILCERAASAGGNGGCDGSELTAIAAAMELIHIASLIHDDVLDAATMRHGKPTVNVQYGEDASIVLGDYVYSKAFQLIGRSGDPGIFTCVGEAIHSMCEGELIHICQRRNLDLSKDSYILIAKKKTASLFAACCQAGTIIGKHNHHIQEALREFGLNFGVAFQLMDDCRDFIGEEVDLGKCPGQDVITGDITLPLLALSDAVGREERREIKKMLSSTNDRGNLIRRLKTMFADSNALSRTRDVLWSYLRTARRHLDMLADSAYKDSLNQLVNYVAYKTSEGPAE